MRQTGALGNGFGKLRKKAFKHDEQVGHLPLRAEIAKAADVANNKIAHDSRAFFQVEEIARQELKLPDGGANAPGQFTRGGRFQRRRLCHPFTRYAVAGMGGLTP